MTLHTPLRLLAAACLLLASAIPASAQADDLFISEYIEGSSNNKAIEIYNGTGTPVNLAAGGYNIQMFFNGSAAAGLTINLVGTVAPGDVFVLAQSSANAAILAQADQTNGSGWFNGDDAVVLRKGTTVIDVIGQVGFDPGAEWGSGLQSTADNTLRRMGSVCAGDPIGADAFAPAGEWEGYATDTFAGLGAHTAACGSGGNQEVTLTCAKTLWTVQGTAVSTVVSATDPDGIVNSLAVASVTPSPAAGSIGLSSFTPALISGGTATGDIAVDAAVPAGNYAVEVLAGNADPVQQTSTCTITVNVTLPREIWEIQGDLPVSPFAGQKVRTLDNIVTAVTVNGFFMQTPDARADASAQTSNGIFVFTGGAPGVAIGDQVDVTGNVTEYFELTEFSNNPVVTVDSSGNPLPTHVVLNEFVPSPAQACLANELERFEGMLVRVTNGRATAPTDRFGDVAIVARDTRAFREPGIECPGIPGYGVWDRNPEIFEIDPNGAKLPDVTLTAGSAITLAEGPLTYAFGDYQILPTAFEYELAPLPRPVRARAAGEFTVASQNLLQFYDNVDDGADDGSDPPPSVEQYAARLAKASLHIRTVLGAPDVLALQEVESLKVLGDLAAQIAADDPSLAYTAHLLPGNDVGGIDVGFLVRSDTLHVSDLVQVGKDTLFTFGAETSPLHDRPPLVLTAEYVGNAVPFPVTVIAVHNRSLRDIETERVQQKRLAQAEDLAKYIDALQEDTTRRIVVVGDFNAFQFSDGYVDALGIITGSLDPAGALRPPAADHVNPDLKNLVFDLPPSERYSFVFEGSAQVLDHVLTTGTLNAFVRTLQYARGNADAPRLPALDPTTPLALSDHDAPVLFLGTRLRCDVDVDYDIDLTDLLLVRNANGQPASSPADPRDGNGDGKINVADTRYCQLRCTRPGCSIQ